MLELDHQVKHQICEFCIYFFFKRKGINIDSKREGKAKRNMDRVCFIIHYLKMELLISKKPRQILSPTNKETTSSISCKSECSSKCKSALASTLFMYTFRYLNFKYQQILRSWNGNWKVSVLGGCVKFICFQLSVVLL